MFSENLATCLVFFTQFISLDHFHDLRHLHLNQSGHGTGLIAGRCGLLFTLICCVPERIKKIKNMTIKKCGPLDLISVIS